MEKVLKRGILKTKITKKSHLNDFSSFYACKYTKGLLMIVKAESTITKFF